MSECAWFSVGVRKDDYQLQSAVTLVQPNVLYDLSYARNVRVGSFVGYTQMLNMELPAKT